MEDKDKLATALIAAAALQQSNKIVNLDLGQDNYDLTEMSKILSCATPKRKQKPRTAQIKKQRVKSKQARQSRKTNRK